MKNLTDYLNQTNNKPAYIAIFKMGYIYQFFQLPGQILIKSWKSLAADGPESIYIGHIHIGHPLSITENYLNFFAEEGFHVIIDNPDGPAIFMGKNLENTQFLIQGKIIQKEIFINKKKIKQKIGSLM